ncbi:RNA-directed DNA polymerase, eukaryota, reverse transcriptase zinc-binding domain protein [Tanacetum coccineum]
MEGDENSSFFHGSLKKKRRHLAIKGVLKNGEWIEDPTYVKVEFMNHFRDRFQIPNRIPPMLAADMLNRLTIDQNKSLECFISHDEIKRSVWDCGGDRAPGPDGFIFKFFTTFWDTVEHDVTCFVLEFFHSGTFPKGFDFEKAFDSLRWDFLDIIMDKLGFGIKWRSWINGCLQNARASVLVNGSPSSEFELFNGLRQGDPLSPFLFILAMEGLHGITCKAVEMGIFRGATFGNGVGVSDENVSNLAKAIGCGAANLPMMYLGVPIGCNMARSRHSTWGAILSSINHLKQKGVDLLSLCIRKLGNGVFTRFWEDSWCEMLSYQTTMILGNGRPTLLLDSQSLRSISSPSRVNLDRRGIDVDSTLCPICQEDVETVNHIFFNCEMAKDLWALMARWWELDIPLCANILEWFNWLDSLLLPKKARLFLEGVGGTLLWFIWSFRNHLVFSNPPPKKAVLWDSIVSQSYLWISSRNPKFKFSLEVTRKKYRSVFKRLNFPQPKTTSMVNDLAKISLSVYVSNFPSHLTVRELWIFFSKMGTLVDVYIAKRKKKLCQMFSFCRYIRVSNSDTLIGSLNKVWIGNFRLHAKVARFHRKVVVKAPHADVKVDPPIVKSDHNVFYASKATSYASAAKAPVGGSNNTKADYEESGENNSSRIKLKQMTTTDFPLAILGCYKDFRSIANTRSLCVPIRAYGIMMCLTRLSKRLCIKSSHAMLVFATNMVSLDDVTYAIRVRELCSWTHTFVGENYTNDDVGSMGSFYQEGDGMTGENDAKSIDSSKDMGYDVALLDSDPFGLDFLIKKKYGKKRTSGSESIHKHLNEGSHKQSGFSLLERLKETIMVGLALGLNMEGCESTLFSLIAENGDLKKPKSCMWIYGCCVKCGEILTSTLPQPVEGLWTSIDVRIMWIAVYAPENLSSKIALWSTLANMIDNWVWILVVMGDFNEVRDAGESFFHGSLKKKRRHLAIKGVLKNGEWIEDPTHVKAEFMEHFQDRFQIPNRIPPMLAADMLNHLTVDQNKSLECSISRDEIKRAVWDCGGDRAPGPDGFTFKFFTTFWDTVEHDVTRFVLEFFHSGTFPKGCNSPFVALIPKSSNAKLSTVIGSCISAEQSAFIKGRNILDGPLVLNEVIAWYRKCKKDLLIFKVDFEKDFDSLRWDFLDMIMDKLGFGIKQGDPLSSFLFILAMEGLHGITCKAVEMGIFRGATFGNGVGVSDENVSNMAKAIGCGAANLPMKYLGVPIGCNMARSRHSTWGAILSSINHLKQKGVDLLSLCIRKLGNGGSTRFWEDSWCGDQPLKAKFPSIYMIDSDRSYVVLSDHHDSWQWSPDSSTGFTVLRLLLNKLPSIVNLDRRGIDVDSTLCPICQEDVETVNHIFFNCEMTKDLWALRARWWELDIPLCANILEWFNWLNSLLLPKKARLFIEGVGGTLLWFIWSFRNHFVFSKPPPKKAVLWDSIVSQSYLWISSRNPKFKFSWVGWLKNPLVTIASL